jgi:hypothetical protein
MDIDIDIPPLVNRMNILNEYNKAKKLMGFDNASRAYRRSMQSLYERYNPELARQRSWQEKKKGYSEDY